MKKLVTIIKLSEVTDAFQLEKQFALQRKDLKKYLKSLIALKRQAKANFLLLNDTVASLKSMNERQMNSKEKKNQIDYFTAKATRIFPRLEAGLAKPAETYEKIRNRAKSLIGKIHIFLMQSKLSFVTSSEAHEQVVKDYASKCFPETTSILYMIGLVSEQKIAKVEDALKEKSLKDETILYMKVVNELIEKITELKEEASQIGHDYYIGVGGQWKELSFQLSNQVNTNAVDENELEQYEDGKDKGGQSDRSGKSNQSFKTEEAIEEQD